MRTERFEQPVIYTARQGIHGSVWGVDSNAILQALHHNALFPCALCDPLHAREYGRVIRVHHVSTKFYSFRHDRLCQVVCEQNTADLERGRRFY